MTRNEEAAREVVTHGRPARSTKPDEPHSTARAHRSAAQAGPPIPPPAPIPPSADLLLAALDAFCSAADTGDSAALILPDGAFFLIVRTEAGADLRDATEEEVAFALLPAEEAA